MNRARLTALVSVVAVTLLAVLVNIYAARHFRRWDWTQNRRYSLSVATHTTLRALDHPIEIWVTLGRSDPLEPSVHQLLEAYRAETGQLAIHYVDPDRDTMALVDLRKRFSIEAGRTEDGRVVTDAVIVVADASKHWFIVPDDLYEAGGEDGRAEPREEQAITRAIRHLVSGVRVPICFSEGHGEPRISDRGTEGLGHLRDLLEKKNNFELRSVRAGDRAVADPFRGCEVVVVAAPRVPFSSEEEGRLRTYLLGGGNLLLAASPLYAGSSETGMMKTGLERALRPFGVELADELVIEADPSEVVPNEHLGVQFFATVRPHVLSQGLVPEDSGRRVPRVILHFARPVRSFLPDGSAVPTTLLLTSASSYSLSSVSGASDWGREGVPPKPPTAAEGPFAVAMASERPKIRPTDSHGPRAVVIGTGGVVDSQNWSEPPEVRGAAMLVDNAVSWLASQPEVLDVPQKSAVSVGLRITEEQRREIFRRVVVFIPLAAFLLALTVFFWRRAGERREPTQGRNA